MNEVVCEVTNLTPYMLVVGGYKDPKQAFLVADKKIVSEVQCFEDLPFCLMSAYFVFNIHYPTGCSNFFQFMEVITLNFPVKKASLTVKHFMASIDI